MRVIRGGGGGEAGCRSPKECCNAETGGSIAGEGGVCRRVCRRVCPGMHATEPVSFTEGATTLCPQLFIVH